jgi:hypothetical protein
MFESRWSASTPGSTVIVGAGPERASLERRYPHARFLGAGHGDALGARLRERHALFFRSGRGRARLVPAICARRFLEIVWGARRKVESAKPRRLELVGEP